MNPSDLKPELLMVLSCRFHLFQGRCLEKGRNRRKMVET